MGVPGIMYARALRAYPACISFTDRFNGISQGKSKKTLFRFNDAMD
jgi:hypothetical protein